MLYSLLRKLDQSSLFRHLALHSIQLSNILSELRLWCWLDLPVPERQLYDNIKLFSRVDRVHSNLMYRVYDTVLLVLVFIQLIPLGKLLFLRPVQFVLVYTQANLGECGETGAHEPQVYGVLDHARVASLRTGQCDRRWINKKQYERSRRRD